MKFTLLASAALLSGPISAAEPSPPVGTREVALTGADQGTAYVTFEDDHEFTAYGLSRKSLGLFTFAGTWTINGAGQLEGSYTESINGDMVTGSLVRKPGPKSIKGSISATNGNFTFKAKPATATQDLTGSWSGIAIVGKQRLPELYQIVPSSLPHVYRITGTGISPASGEYSILGTLLAGAAGKVELVAFRFDPWGASGFSTLRGQVNAARKQLNGTRPNGSPIRVSLRR